MAACARLVAARTRPRSGDLANEDVELSSLL